LTRVLALDYGVARTGVAVSDATGTVVRPVTVVRRASTLPGLRELADIVQREQAELVIVGIPVSLDAKEHGQAREVRSFIARLVPELQVPVVTYDERFTTKVAQARGGAAGIDARAAAVLLEDYLRSVAGPA
jgi:putative holliday junction resolvase